ncbi:unnamed protein product [Adineta steineri]|uniref:Ubiquitin thioesterase OTU n=1 Tax=Adineta steineri TaxID=433720 RepID=A0A814WBB4_9BILA|nr:unnamed protein product [Adineta steineri]CAF3751505.1 unnamed protein product [Adineta steineri]
MASDITEETRKFRLSDGSDFYNCVVLGTKINLDTKRAYELVQDRSSCRAKQAADTLPKNINEENEIINRKPRLCKANTTTVTEDEIEILGLHTKTRLCIIYATKHNKIISSICVRYYGNNYKESLYMVYDETQRHYCSLYLYNTTDQSGEKRTILPSYDKTINTLLRKFFISNFNYHGDVQLDDEDHTVVNDVLYQEQVEYGDTPCIMDMDTEVNTPAEPGIIDNQISSNVTNSISKTAHTLCRKKIPENSSCLYSSFIDAISLTSTVQDLRSKVADCIFKRKDIFDVHMLLLDTDYKNREEYCNGIRNRDWGGEHELLALSQMHRTIIKVVNLRKDQQQNLSINTMSYGEDDKSCTSCIYLIYDRAGSHYEPLYLCNNEILQDEITTFDLDDTRVDDLLADFIRRQNESNRLSKVMTCTNHMSDESVHISQPIIAKTNSSDANEQYISANNIIPIIQNAVPYEIYEFRIGELPGDDQCLYASVIFQFDRSKMINIKCLRKNVANFIRDHTHNDSIYVPSSLGYQNHEDYCREIEEGIISGSEPERNGLSYLYPDILFCIISKPNKNNNTFCVGTYIKDISSYKKCVIILYNEENYIYMPLCLYNKTTDEEEKTNFKYDDTVKNLLRKFIQNELDYWGYVNFDSGKDNHAMDSPLHIENEPLDLAEMITENHSKNKSEKYNMKKRKAPEDDDNFIINKEMKKLTMNTNNEKTQSLTSSHPLPPNDQISRFHEETDISENIETLIQIDMLASYDPTIANMMEQQQQQQMEDFSTTLSTNTSVAADEQIRFETEPAERFRGRALSDYVPKSETKRDGTKAKPRNPCYFADRNNEHYLNLLISRKFLFNNPGPIWVEIAVVTRSIKGCIYLNPLFDFCPYKDGSFGDPCNPMLIKLEDVEMYPLTKYTDELQKLMLQLVVIMVKNDELVKKQPIIPFSSLSSNGQRHDAVYRTHDTFKNTFQLNDLRFAVTLWTQGPNDQEYQRRPDIQYISPVSTQDKKVKLYD